MVFPEWFIAGINKQANRMDVYDTNNFVNATNHAEGKLCHNRVPTDMILVSNKNILQKNNHIVYFLTVNQYSILSYLHYNHSKLSDFFNKKVFVSYQVILFWGT